MALVPGLCCKICTLLRMRTARARTHTRTHVNVTGSQAVLYPAWFQWERIVDVVAGGTELEARVKSGSLAGCSHS